MNILLGILNHKSEPDLFPFLKLLKLKVTTKLFYFIHETSCQLLPLGNLLYIISHEVHYLLNAKSRQDIYNMI